MKILHILLAVITAVMFANTTVNANWWPNPDPVPVLCDGDDCGFQQGTIQAQGSIDGIITDTTFSDFVIQLIQYLTTFLTLIGVIIIIYAGFTILVSGGDEEKLKSARKLILYAILGIILIWLAYAIMTFIVSILDGSIEPASDPVATEVLTP